MVKKLWLGVGITVLALLFSGVGIQIASAAELAERFTAPPENSKPWVYMWRSNREVTEADYSRHLQQLKEKGFGGFIHFAGEPPKWAVNPLFKHVLKEAEQHGLVMAVNNTGAWPAGGSWISRMSLPWATVSSTLDVEGGRRFNGKLPQPALPEDGGEKNAAWLKANVATVAVQAFRLSDQPLPAAAKVIASSNPEGINAMFDGSWNTTWMPNAPPEPSKPWPSPWVVIDFGTPHEVDTAWVSLVKRGISHLECSDDNVNFRRFHTLDRISLCSFPVQKARYFRVFLNGSYVKREQWGIRDLAIGTRNEVERFVQMASKRGLNFPRQSEWIQSNEEELTLAFAPLKPLPNDQVLASKDRVDLTDKIAPDGTLAWDVPPGRWRIVRLCRSIASGTEIGFGLPDYLNPEATREDFEKGMHTLGKAAPDKVGKVLQYYHEDNNEIHCSYNWTPLMFEEFQKRRGYDPRPYLAAMAGEIVDSLEITDRFLADVRRTIADCVAENHYGKWTELAHAAGMKTRGEVGGIYHPMLCHDGMANLARVDLMNGEFWPHGEHKENLRSTASRSSLEWLEGAQNTNAKQVASTSHLYGKPIVDMESFTSLGNFWQTAPADLLLHANVAFCEGVNQMSFHGSDTTAAVEGSPGTVFVGTHFNDKNTWWPYVKPFVNYIHRCSALLRCGHFVGDVLYYIGDEVPALVHSKQIRSSLGFGYDYDECNSEALLNCLKAEDGQLVSRSGTSYRVLVLPERPVLTLPVARKIQEFVRAGVPVIGPRPIRTPGLSGYPQCDAELKAIADDLWSGGKVTITKSEKQVLNGLNVPVDFAVSGGQADTLLDFIHRKDGEADIYFVINRRNRAERVDVTFRVVGKQPELWNAFSGRRQNAAAYTIAAGRTTVPLELSAYGSFFVVFANPAVDIQGHGKDNCLNLKPMQEITGPWKLRFDPKWGGPQEEVTYEQLADWTSSAEEGIKYYSGVVTYHKTFDSAPFTGTQLSKPLFLDLGVVNQLAVIRLNGTDLGVVWCAPWRVEIPPEALKLSGNRLEIDVVNTWLNRMVLDLSRPKEKRLIDIGSNSKNQTWNIPKLEKAKLQPSGLMGPVTIQQVK